MQLPKFSLIWKSCSTIRTEHFLTNKNMSLFEWILSLSNKCFLIISVKVKMYFATWTFFTLGGISNAFCVTLSKPKCSIVNLLKTRKQNLSIFLSNVRKWIQWIQQGVSFIKWKVENSHILKEWLFSTIHNHPFKYHLICS